MANLMKKVKTFFTGATHYRSGGASTQGTLSNFKEQPTTSYAADKDKDKVRNRAWQLYKDDALAKGMLEGIPQETVNIGITPQASPDTEFLGRDQAWEDEYTGIISGMFNIWGLGPDNWCDISRRQNFYMLQALAMFTWAIDGKAVFQRATQVHQRAPLSLAWNAIDPGMLITPTDLDKDRIVFGGVELDKNTGQPINIFIRKQTTGYSLSTDYNTYPVYDKETGFQNILIVCDVRQISEVGQDSMLSPVIKEILDLHDTVDASIVKKLISNMWTFFVESPLGPPDQSGEPAQVDRIEEIEKGTIIFGAGQQKPELIQGYSESEESGIIVDRIMERAGMAALVGVENVLRRYNSSYSASRAARIIAEMFNDSKRMVLNSRFNDPIFQWFTYELILRGYITSVPVQEYLSPYSYAYSRMKYLNPPSHPIDPAKQAKADEINLKNGTTSLSEIFGQKSQDWKKAVKQQLIEAAYKKKMAVELGVELEDEPEEPTQETEPEEPEDDENENNQGDDQE